jgi:hypothetical protein
MKTVNISTKAKTVTSLLNREIELTRQNKALMKLLDERGQQKETFKAREVKEQLGIE